MAAEFYVLGLLNRLDFDASLTLGNTKKVDIVVTTSGGRTLTIDSKGAVENMRYILPGDLHEDDRSHYYAFVYFRKAFRDPAVAPEVYIVPASELPSHVYCAPGGGVKQLRPTAEFRGRYINAWRLLGELPGARNG